MTNRSKRSLKNRVPMTLLAIILAWGSVSFLFALPIKAGAEAFIAETWYSYYTDTTYENQVGWAHLDCYGVLHVHGTQTSYFIIDEQFMCE
jgi:hypothetical protein